MSMLILLIKHSRILIFYKEKEKAITLRDSLFFFSENQSA